MEFFNKHIIVPSTLSIITTYRCSSACENCCFQCNPLRKEMFSIDEMRKYIKESVDAFPTIKVLVLTGGECFLLQEGLDTLIEYATNLGLSTRVVTNGFWAKEYFYACKRIKELVDVGLKEINFSTGDEHLEYVSFDTVKNGLLASITNGLTTVLNVESASHKKFNSKKLLADVDLDRYIKEGQLCVLNGIWVPFKKQDTRIITEAEECYNYKTHLHNTQRCLNIFNSITIDPNYRMLACCGIAVKCIKYLDLGNIKKHSIKYLYEKQFDDFLKLWIATEGPHKIMKFISEYVPVKDFETMHSCQVCSLIFNNPLFLKVLKEQYRKIYTKVLLEYNINKEMV